MVADEEEESEPVDLAVVAELVLPATDEEDKLEPVDVAVTEEEDVELVEAVAVAVDEEDAELVSVVLVSAEEDLLPAL